MSLFGRFKDTKPKSANIAKERLQIIVSHERNRRSAPSYLSALQNDILAVIKKYVDVDADQIHINVSQQNNTSVLEMNVNLPD